jgi:DNA-binding NarL/FixJ family response regulator
MRSDILLFGSGATTEAALHWAIAHRSVHIETVRSIDEAHLRLARGNVDVLICDDEISGMAWLDVLIQAARRFAPIISIVTAHLPPAEAMTRAINDGRVFAFLPKPLDCNSLRHSLDEALSRSMTSFAVRHSLEAANPSPVYRPLAATRSGPEGGPAAGGFHQPFTGLPGDLSAREWEVLGLLADGLTTRQIAKRLFISVYTVRNHLKSMYRKLEVHSQSELIDWHQSAYPQMAAG